MARVILPIVGTVVGAYFGNPQLGFAIGSALGNLADPVKINGPGIGDLQVQTGRENVPRAIIYGTAAVAGNLIFSGAPKVIKKSSSGKGAPKVTTTTQTLTYGIRVAEGPIGGIIRIWEDEALVYDTRTTPDIPAADTVAFAAGINIHLGGEDQLPDAAIEAEVGVDLAPYHRGSAYVVFVNKDLTDRGGRIPQYRFEVSSNAIGNTTPTLVLSLATIPDSSNMAGVAVANNKFIRWTGFPPTLPRSSDDCVDWTVGTVDTEFFSGTTDSTPVFFEGLYQVFSGAGFVSRFQSTNAVNWVKNGVAPFTDATTINSVILNGEWYIWDGHATRRVWKNDGISWSLVGTVGAANSGTIFRKIRSNGSILIAINSANRVVRSTDGLTWADVTTSEMTTIAGSSGRISAAEYSPADGSFFVMIINTINANSPVFFRSSDGGLTWANSGTVSTSTQAFDILAISEQQWVLGQVGSADIKCSPSPTFAMTLNPGDPVPLPAIVADISDRAQVTADKIDVSLLTGTVDGFSLGGFFTASAALEPLRGGHFFDAGEWDGKIHFVPRGGESVATITADDLVEDPEETRRGQAMEFPRKLHLEYQNSTIAYAPTKHTAERISPDVRVTGEVRLSTSEVMVSDEAARRATIMQKLAWIEAAGEITFAIADNFSWLTPSDVITLSARGKSRRLRIEKTEIADGIVRLTCKPDRASTYQSTATGSVILPPRPPASTNPGVTVWHWLNIPALTDNADLLGSYFGATGSSEGWAGALLQRSIDAGASYEDTATNGGAIIGALVDPLPFAPADFTDTNNTLRVSLVNLADDLESITYEQMLMERNAIAIGGPGAWEIVQYQTAVEESPGVWALSTLLRGRLNTKPLNHIAGNAFVELSGVSFVANTIAQIGVSLTHRGVGINALPEGASVMTETYSPARTQHEWAPEAVSGIIAGSTLSASWIPRHRFGTSVNPVPSINFAGYRVTVTGTGGVVSQDTATASADIDVSGLSAPITLSVAMLNRITGPGDSAILEVA